MKKLWLIGILCMGLKLFQSHAFSIERPVFLAHYMPWFQTPEIHGYWGWHWTMNHFNPNRMDSSGRREIASHHYPLTGPYDSSDGKILEYQLMLMKLAGIDGVLVDWYGIKNFRDYGTLHESTCLLFEWIKKADMQFAIVYEDQTLKHMVQAGVLSANSVQQHVQEVMVFMEENWFSSPYYCHLDGRPLLLTFGPQYLKTSEEWEKAFSGLSSPPLFFTLDERLSPVAVGAYPWPPMWKSGGDGILSQSELTQYLENFYQKASAWPYRVASAFPGFHDIYQEAGVGQNYGFLDDQEGKTFRITLERALQVNPNVVQLVTWNDYGEGTEIEPTQEFGYRYLEMIQEIRKTQYDQNFPATPEDLRMPLKIWTLRITAPEKKPLLDRVRDHIFKMNLDSARILFRELVPDSTAGEKEKIGILEPNYPNPFQTKTTIPYRLSKSAFITIEILNLKGEKVASLYHGNQTQGMHTTVWDSENASAGCYIIRLTAGSFRTMRKCMKLS